MEVGWRSCRYWASFWVLWCVKGPVFGRYVNDNLGFVRTFKTRKEADEWAEMYNRIERGRHE